MKLIDRYLLREYLGATAYCLAAFLMLYVLVDMFERLPDFIEAGIPWSRIALFYAHFIMAFNGPTSFFALILPISMLLGLLYALYGFSRHNELTAMRACGISLSRLMLPFVGVACAAALMCLWVQEHLAPPASLQVEAMTRALRGGPLEEPPKEPYPFYYPPSRRQWQIGRFYPHQPHILENVRIVTEREDHTRASELVARRAEWLDGAWWFFDVQTRQFDESGQPTGPMKRASHPIEKRDFSESPEDMSLGIRRWELFSAFQMWTFIRNHPNLSPADRARRLVDLHIRLAMPWVCLIVTLLGIPGGIHTHRQGALTGILSAIFFLFVYYTLLQAGNYMGKRLIIPPWSGAWFPNAVFFAASLIMIRRLK